MTDVDPKTDNAKTGQVKAVWSLLVDHEKNLKGEPFPIEIPSSHTVGHLRDVVKEKMVVDLQGVVANRLKVWRCKDRQTVFEEDSAKLEEQVKQLFLNGVEELGTRRKFEKLDYKEEEILIVTMPGVSPSPF